MFANIIGAILQIAPKCSCIIFHGSRAIGAEREDSDWDILVVVAEDQVPNGGAYLELAKQLATVAANTESPDGNPLDIQPCRPSGNLYRVALAEGRMLWLPG